MMALLLCKQQCRAFTAEEFGRTESPGKCRNESPELGYGMLVTRLSLTEVRNGLLFCARQFFIGRLVVDEQYLV